MKKFLLTAVLILAVLTTLTAGTLAAYTQTQTIDGNVAPMYFAFTRTGSAEFTSGVRLAPGKSQMYAVTIKNWSEMPVTFDASRELSGTEGFTNLLNSYWYSDSAGTGTASTTFAPFTLAAGVQTNVYLKVTWNDSLGADATEVALSQDGTTAATLHVSITGTSAL